MDEVAPTGDLVIVSPNKSLHNYNFSVMTGDPCILMQCLMTAPSSSVHLLFMSCSVQGMLGNH